MQESGDECEFGCLTEMCCNSPWRLGFLTSDRFSEIIASEANLLVDMGRLHLNDEMIEKIIVSRMRKRLIERVRTKKYFSPAMFGNDLSDESENT